MADAFAKGRRAHRKSRNGCQQCKKRKVKCDERKPTCRNCAQHNIECSFSLPNPDEGPNPAPQPSPFKLQTGVHAELAIQDLELLHHYSTSTAYTFSRHPAMQTVWRVKLPQIAFGAPYALRAILAVSALHLAYLRPEQKQFYISQAEHHHNTALKIVTPGMSRVMQENSTAMFLFSILTCFISCAKPRNLGDFLLLDQDRISDWLVLFRGSGAIINFANDALRTGPLGAMFNIRERQSQIRDEQSTDGLGFMDDLKRLVHETIPDPNEEKIYLDAIGEMCKSFATDSGKSQSWETSDVFVWLMQISDQFLLRLREHKPVALVIFGHFCVLLRQLEWIWCMEGWGVHLLERIYHLLDEEHRNWVQWPMEQVGWVP